MTADEAFYCELILRAGFTEEYDRVLDGFLEAEDPLSNIVLDLSCLNSDINGAISCLHNYCAEHAPDHVAVHERLRLFLKHSHRSGKMSRYETVCAMESFCSCVNELFGYMPSVWDDMYTLCEMCNLAAQGLSNWNKVGQTFDSYLDDGTGLRFYWD